MNYYLVCFLRKELYFLKISNFIQAAAYSMLTSYVVASSLMTFVSLVLSGDELTPEDVFTTIIVLASIQKMLTLFGDAIELMSRLLVSLKRIQKFLSLPDENTDVPLFTFMENESTGKETGNGLSNSTDGKKIHRNMCTVTTKPCINVSQAHWYWPDANEKCFTDVNLYFHGSQFVLIHGAIGSGKSCLLQAINNQFPMASGLVQIKGKITYLPQCPWIFSGTISQNILFGKDFDEERFCRVIKACLLEDLVSSSQRSLRQVGERGMCLSSSEHARISLARALYADTDIYLLDDPFKEFDTVIKKHIFAQCVKGLLLDRLCILVTKELEFAQYADKVLLLKNRTIEENSTIDVHKIWTDDSAELYDEEYENNEQIRYESSV